MFCLLGTRSHSTELARVSVLSFEIQCASVTLCDRVAGRQPFNAEPPLSLLVDSGFITPTALHFVRNYAGVPIIDRKEHKLVVNGNVRNERVFSMDQIERMPSLTLPVTLVAGGNRRKEHNMLEQTLR